MKINTQAKSKPGESIFFHSLTMKDVNFLESLEYIDGEQILPTWLISLRNDIEERELLQEKPFVCNFVLK